MRVDQLSGAVHVHAITKDVAKATGGSVDGPILGYVFVGAGPRHVIVSIKSVGDPAGVKPSDLSCTSYAFVFPRGCGLSESLVSRGGAPEHADDLRRLAKWLGWHVYEVR